MPMQNEKYRVTQTLLSSWLGVYKFENGYNDFLRTLNRQKTPQTKAMLDGIHFENVVNHVLIGEPIDETHKWYKPIMQIYDELCSSQQQVALFKDVNVSGYNVVLHGILDFLKAGVIYDTKFSKTYHVGKYLSSPQHPMYFALVPEAYKFQYTICDGKYIYRETYYPEQCEPIEKTISDFFKFLERQNLMDTYKAKWLMKGDYIK